MAIYLLIHYVERDRMRFVETWEWLLLVFLCLASVSLIALLTRRLEEGWDRAAGYAFGASLGRLGSMIAFVQLAPFSHLMRD